MLMPQTLPDWVTTIILPTIIAAVGWACRELRNYLVAQQEQAKANSETFINYLIKQEERAVSEREGWRSLLADYRTELGEHTAISKQMHAALQDASNRLEDLRKALAGVAAGVGIGGLR